MLEKYFFVQSLSLSLRQLDCERLFCFNFHCFCFHLILLLRNTYNPKQKSISKPILPDSTMYIFQWSTTITSHSNLQAVISLRSKWQRMNTRSNSVTHSLIHSINQSINQPIIILVIESDHSINLWTKKKKNYTHR